MFQELNGDGRLNGRKKKVSFQAKRADQSDILVSLMFCNEISPSLGDKCGKYILTSESRGHFHKNSL